MKRYGKFNPKKRIARSGTHDPEQLCRLAEAVTYTGNPEHKRNPRDFGLTPPAQPRRGKTLCDIAGIFTAAEALEYLQNGLRRAAVSEIWIGEWPKLIWAVTGNGVAMEAQRDCDGSYHGYPLPEGDPMAAEVKKFWSAR